MASSTMDKSRPESLILDEKVERPESGPTLYDEKLEDTNNPGGDTPKNETPKDDASNDGTDTTLTGWKLMSLMTSITLAAFLMLLDMSIITTAIPRITDQFHSLSDIGWYGSAYNLASAALQPLSGKLYTYFKSKWLFLGFLFIFELGCLICGVASSSNMLIIGRAVAGIGSSGIQNGAFTMIAASVPLERRPPLVGILMGCAQLGIVFGPLVGGALTEYSTWRWCFYINLPIGAVCTILILLINIPDRVAKTDESILKTLTTKLDITGFLIFSPCTVMFLLALQWGGNEHAWDSATIIGLFCGGVATLAVFIYWEYRAGDGAMIPLSVVRKRQVWTACLTMLLLFVTVFVAAYYLPIYFQSVKGASPFKSGVDLLPSILSQLVAAVSIGVIVSKVGYYLPFSVLSAMIMAVGNGLLTTLSPDSSVVTWAGYQIIIGLGRGIGMQMAIIAIQANTAPEVTSIATAVLVFSQTFGGAVFVSVSEVIFSTKLKNELVSRLPHLDADAIASAGATAVRQVVPAKDLPEALAAYCKGVNSVFYLTTAAACLMFLTSWGIGWNDIRKKETKAPENEGSA